MVWGTFFPEDFYRGTSLKHTFILQFQEPYNPSKYWPEKGLLMVQFEGKIGILYHNLTQPTQSLVFGQFGHIHALLALL